MTSEKIPEEILINVSKIVDTLTTKHQRNLSIRSKGRFVYVDEDGGPLCRLKYIGKKDDWDFAIFKWSTERYSDNEFLFPSSGSAKALIETALEAYS